MLSIFILLFFLKLIDSEPICKKGENNCAICNPLTKLCIKCEYDVLIPDDNGGCKKAGICILGKNNCIECSNEGNLCKICDEGYFQDKNGGCSYSNYCDVSYKGKCIKCIENYILNEEINICKSLSSNEFANCQVIQKSNGLCEKCEQDYYLTSEDKRCTKTENCSESLFGNCIKCNKGYYLDKKENKCILQTGNLLYCKDVIDGINCNSCEDGYYFDQGGKCVSTNYCEKRSKLGTCEKCISGYFLSEFDRTCTNTENCYTGIKEVGICNKCRYGYYIDFKDGICKSNQEDNEFRYCITADAECIECFMNYYLGDDHKCTNNKYCSESNNGICLACKDNYYLGLDNKCSNIEHCIYSNEYECLECENNYYYDKQKRKCKIWEGNFENCKYGYEDKGCQRCKDDFYLNQTNNLCYSNNLNNDYYKCAMTDSYGIHCTTCIEGYYLGYKYHRCSKIQGCVYSEDDYRCLECDSFHCLDTKTGLCEDNNNKENKKYYKCAKTNKEGTACEECLTGLSLDDDGNCVFKK